MLLAERAPGATLVSACAAPGAAAVPPGATRASWFVVPVRCTGPVEPFEMLVERLVTWVPSESTDWLVALSWLPFTASVLDALNRPAATLVIVRSLPTVPTLTVLVGVAPAKV